MSSRATSFLDKNHFLRLCKMVLGCFCLMGIAYTNAEPLNLNFPEGGITISPRSCLVKSGNHFCERDLVVSWHFEVKTDFCLLVDNGLILFCENKQLKGERTLSSRLKKTTKFEIVEQGTQRKLSELTVYVVKENSAKLKKRYRHPWSVF